MRGAADTVVSAEELAAVARLACAAAPNEVDGNGVWVHAKDGARVWTGAIDGLVWCYEGAATADHPPMGLPARLIWAAAELAAGVETDRCRIRTEGSVAIAEVADASVVIDLLSAAGADPHLAEWTDSVASATSTVSRLRRALSQALTLPVGADASSASVDVALVIADGGLTLSADWPSAGRCRTTLTVPACCVGEASCELAAYPLMQFLGAVPAEDEVTVIASSDPDEPLTVEGPGWRAMVARRPTAVDRFSDELGQRIADASGERCFAISPTVFETVLAGRTIRVELHDEGLQVLRCSTVVVHGVDATPALYDQINDANAGMVGARLWYSSPHRSIIAATDLPAGRVEDLAGAFQGLVRQLDGFDVFLSCFGVCP